MLQNRALQDITRRPSNSAFVSADHKPPLANAALVPAGADGAVDADALNTTHVTIDTNGVLSGDCGLLNRFCSTSAKDDIVSQQLNWRRD
ncbi:MAG: hypothetical protein JNL98_32325 [Bryobacterales bacterium]|nr:hypothetical protein [Bryobacterales bacterium]